ncbi:hypothetical protein EDD86DRAFT_202359 [Gorgonomyces haynaldii]|nr:hypothetical protein EDD86DRAFT_202359 [Gorgonomyces haynaldii]
MEQQLLSDLLEACYSQRNLIVLQQVRDWLADHSDATVSRPLYNHLPNLTAGLFGSKGSQRLATFQQLLRDCQPWLQFLGPEEPFMQRLMGQMQDNLSFFELSVEHFSPWIKRSILENQELSVSVRDKIIQPQNQKDPKKIRYNMFEFYIFWCAQTPIYSQDWKPPKDLKQPKIPSRDLASMDPGYLKLIQLYLDFFLPRKDLKKQQKKISNVFGVYNPIQTSHFVIVSFMDMWLCQNDPKARQAFVKPTGHQLDCILLLVKHIISLNLVNVDKRTDTSDQFEISKCNAYRELKPRLYHFIKICLEQWPRDDSLAQLLDIWIQWMTPWQQFTDEWAWYVQDNFLFYSHLAYIFIQRSKSFELYSSFWPISRNNRKQYYSMTEKVLNLFNNQKLFFVLEKLENAYQSLDAYTPHTPITNKIYLSSPSMSPRKSMLNDLNQFENSGPKTRTAILQLEQQFQYHPLFSKGELLHQLIFNLARTKERLEYLLVEKEKPSFFQQLFGDPVQQLTARDRTHVEKSVKQIQQLMTNTCKFWRLDIEHLLEQTQGMRRSPSEDALDNVAEVAPGVFAPEQASQLRLTRRGRDQIRRGLRKSNPDDVQVQGHPTKLLISDHEVAFLVPLTLNLAQYLNPKVSQFIRVRRHAKAVFLATV